MNKGWENLEPVFASDADTQVIKRLEEKLGDAPPKLVGMDGEEIILPEPLYQVLSQVIHMMAAGQVISLVPHDHYLSTQEAAEILNVDRPFIYTLLEKREIPYTMLGTHRRIQVQHLMEYKRKRDSRRHQALNELIAFSQEEGFYE